MRPALARVAGVGHVEVLASDTREIEVIADPRAPARRRPDRAATSPTRLKAANQLAPVGRYPSAGLQHLVLASGLWKSVADIAATPVVVAGRRDHARGRRRDGLSPARPTGRRSITGNGRPAAAISVSQQVGANILDVRAGVEAQLARPGAVAARRAAARRRPTTSPSSSPPPIANVRDAILLGGLLAVIVLLLFLRDWRLTLVAAMHAAAHRPHDVPRDAARWASRST